MALIAGFVQVLEVLESTWNSSLVFQGLEILEKQHFFGQGAWKSLNFFYITNHMISNRVQWRLQWKNIIKFTVYCVCGIPSFAITCWNHYQLKRMVLENIKFGAGKSLKSPLYLCLVSCKNPVIGNHCIVRITHWRCGLLVTQCSLSLVSSIMYQFLSSMTYHCYCLWHINFKAVWEKTYCMDLWIIKPTNQVSASNGFRVTHSTLRS